MLIIIVVTDNLNSKVKDKKSDVKPSKPLEESELAQVQSSPPLLKSFSVFLVRAAPNRPYVAGQ